VPEAGTQKKHEGHRSANQALGMATARSMFVTTAPRRQSCVFMPEDLG
jgi:hypothetical protein